MNKPLLDVREPAPIISTMSRDIDLTKITEDDIDFAEAARVLSRFPRYGGQSDVQFSVLQHLLLCDSIASQLNFMQPETCLYILLHDLHEYIIGDIPSPLKRLLNDKSNGFIKELERDIDAAVFAAAGLPSSYEVGSPTHVQIKLIDWLALSYEAHVVYPSVVDRWDVDPAEEEDLRKEVEHLSRISPELVIEIFNNRLLTLMNLVGEGV